MNPKILKTKMSNCGNVILYYQPIEKRKVVINMIIVHDIFICKPGNASKLAKMAGYQDMYLTGSREIYQIM